MQAHEDIANAEKAMSDALTKLEGLRSAYSMAKQIVELAGERRKTALSRLVVEFLDSDQPANAAEHRARADARYKTEMQIIMRQSADAENVIAQWQIGLKQFEAARSILSMERSLLELR